MIKLKWKWILVGLLVIILAGMFLAPKISDVTLKDSVSGVTLEIVAAEQSVELENLHMRNEAEFDDEAETMNSVNNGSRTETPELAEDGTFTELVAETEQEEVGAVVISGESGNGTSDSGVTSGGGSANSVASSGGTTTYSDGSIGHNGVAYYDDGTVLTGLREFASVDDLVGQRPTNGKWSETVSVNGVPYTWTGYEWGDASGFSTNASPAVIEGGLSGELVGH